MKSIGMKSLMDIRFMSEPTLSPDGKHTAYVVAKPNEKENAYDSCIHLLDNTTGETRQLTYAGKESGMIWQDAHTLLFASSRADEDKPEKGKEKTCYYALDIRGGEARKAFEIDKEVTAIRRAGEGRYVLTVLEKPDTVPQEADETEREDEKDYHVLEEIPFWANGASFIAGQRTALYVYDAESAALDKLTAEDFNVLTFDVKDASVVYTGCAYRDRMPLSGEVRLYDLAAKTDIALVTPGVYTVRDAWFFGDTVLAAMHTGQPWGWCQLSDLYRCSLSGDAPELFMRADDLHVGSAAVMDCAFGGGKEFVSVGDEAYFIGQRGCRAEVYRLNAQGERKLAFAFDGCVHAIDADENHLVFVGYESNGLAELYAVEGEQPVRKTHVNDAFLGEHYVAQAKPMPFVNAEGVTIEGWVLTPEGFDAAAKAQYPAVLEIHGGPRGAYGTAFMHEMQMLCGAGYVVMFCNPRGSEGYGEAFADLRGQYGQIDYQDLMAFVDHVLAEMPAIDPARLGAAGGSYGGFMCNWIEGHTDRFAAIASQRSVANWVSDFGTSEIGYTFDPNEMGATPWTDVEKMWRQSPLKYAGNAKTPILFIHSLCDYNCPIGQGMEMFTAMKYFGVPSRMVLFEGENHSLSRSGKPRHRVRRLREILGWFNRYLGAPQKGKVE